MNSGPIPVRPGILQATLQKAGVHYCDYPQPGSIEIPYFDHAGNPIGFSRWRLPKVQANGQKYHQEPGTGLHVYFPPGGLVPAPELYITEGEFKSLSIFEDGYAVLGLCGLYTYQRDPSGNALLLPEIRTALTVLLPKPFSSLAIPIRSQVLVSAGLYFLPRKL
jgi:hypothetical protein